MNINNWIFLKRFSIRENLEFEDFDVIYYSIEKNTIFP